MNPEIELIIKARNEASTALKKLKDQFDKLNDQLGKTEDRSKKTNKQLRDMAPLLMEVNRASALATRAFIGVGRSLIKASADMETFKNTVLVFSSSQEEANRRIEELLQLSKELVGLDTGNIIQFFGRLTQAGLSEERAIQSIKGFTEAIAEQGKTAGVARTVLEQFTQAVAQSRILATDFRTLFREVPQLSRAIQEEFGFAANSSQVFREGIEELGITVPEAFDRLIPAFEALTKGANIDTINAQMDILQDQAFVTAANFGDVLKPAVIEILKQFNDFLQTLQELPQETKNLIVIIGGGAAVGVTLVTAFTAATLSIKAFNAALLIATGATGLKGLSTIITPFLKSLPLLAAGFYAAEVALAAILPGLALYKDLTYENTQNTEDLTEKLKTLGKAEGITKLIEELKPLRKEYFDLIEFFNIKEPDIQIPELRDTNMSSNLKEQRDRLVALHETLKAISPFIKELRDVSVKPVTPEAVKDARNLTLELVKADTVLRRINRSIRMDDAQTIDVINAQTAARIDALQTVAKLEIEQVKKDIEDKNERAARIREIEDRLADDIAEAHRKGQDRIKAYEEAVYAARVESGEAFVEARIAQQRRLMSAEALAMGSDEVWRKFLSDYEKEWMQTSEAVAMGQDHVFKNFMKEYERTIGTSEGAAMKHDAIFRNFLAIENKSRAKANEDFRRMENFREFKAVADAVKSKTDLWRDELHVRRQMEIDATLSEYDEIKKRERLYRNYFKYINQLNLQSKDLFIQSAVQITATIIRQTLIQKAIESAASGNFIGAIGFGAGAIATTGLESVITSALQGQQGNARTQTFHNATNDALVEMAVARALTRRQDIAGHQEFMDNRQQAHDVANAVDQGIRNTPEGAGARPEVFIGKLYVNDKFVQEFEFRRAELADARRIRS